MHSGFEKSYSYSISYSYSNLKFPNNQDKSTNGPSFYWLGSRRKLRNCKRRSSGSPRVPFSSSQLMTLEQTYTENRYLSGPQVAELATSLSLPHHRIKIWFQNRRAREKRSQEETPVSAVPGKLPSLQQQQIRFKHDTPYCLPFSLSASFSMNCFAFGNCTSHYNMLGRCANFDAYSCGRMDF